MVCVLSSQPATKQHDLRTICFYILRVCPLPHLSEHFAWGGCEWEAVSSFLQSSYLWRQRKTNQKKLEKKESRAEQTAAAWDKLLTCWRGFTLSVTSVRLILHVPLKHFHISKIEMNSSVFFRSSFDWQNPNSLFSLSVKSTSWQFGENVAQKLLLMWFSFSILVFFLSISISGLCYVI